MIITMLISTLSFEYRPTKQCQSTWS